MLILKNLEMENYRSFYGNHKFSFDNSGIRHIVGINKDNFVEGEVVQNNHSIGSGKSTFCSAVQFALFGTVKNVNKDDVPNKKVKKNAKVALEFEINANNYRIERYRKHKKHRNNVRLLKKIKNKWEDVGSPDIRATQKEIHDLIIINEETFSKSLLLTRDEKEHFMEFGPPDRGRVFENIVQLNKFKEYHKKVLDKYKLENDNNSTIVSEIIAINSEIKTYEKHIREETEELESKELNIKTKIKSLTKKLKTYTDVGKNINELLEDMNLLYSLLQQHDKIAKDLTYAHRDVTSQESILTKAEQTVSVANKHVESAEYRLENHQPITCHNCGALQDEDEYIEQQKKLHNELQDAQNDLSDSLKEITNIKKQLKAYKTKEKKIKENLQNINNQIKDINLPKKLIDQIKIDVHDNKTNSASEEITQLKQQLEIKETELNALSWDNVKKFNKTLKIKQKKLKKLNEKRVESDSQISMMEFWLQTLDFKNENSIKQHIVSQVLPVFNNIIQDNMDKMYNGTLTLVFDQFFNETILYNGEEFRYHELSTGERAKVNLAINLSIFDMTKINLNGSSVIFMDEIFTNVDPPTIDAALSLIEDKYAKDSCIYMISHKEAVKNYLSTIPTIYVIKEDGESRIEV